jgi:cell division septum initiation protein DivIVA
MQLLEKNTDLTEQIHALTAKIKELTQRVHATTCGR